MAKYVCSVCGYIHEGDAAPERCPQCGVPASKFNKMTEEQQERIIRVIRSCFE